MSTYLTHGSPDAFVDFPPPATALADGSKVVCKKCQGHGGWNLMLNSYPLRDHPDTVENRHKFSHFRASCSACWGWGLIGKATQCPKGEPGEGCAYTGKEQPTGTMCLTYWICDRCGEKTTVDSSD